MSVRYSIPYLFIFLLLLSFGNNALHGQFLLGVKAGLSTFSVDNQELNIFDGNSREEYALALRDGSYGYHFGFWTRLTVGKFIIQPELVFNSNNVEFSFQDDAGNQVGQGVFKESYQELDIPFLVGLDFGVLRLLGGPVGHVYLANSSDLLDFGDYGQTFESMTIGYQLGAGLDVGRWSLDFRYEDNFNNFGEHIRFFGEEYAFSGRPKRILGSLGFSF